MNARIGAETASTSTPTRQGADPILPLWAAILAAAIAGILLNLAFPAYSIWVAVFPAVALLLIALVGRNFWGALLVGIVHGLVFYFVLLPWISRYLGALPWVALATVEGVLTGVALVLIALCFRWGAAVLPGRLGRLVAVPVLVSALWVVKELFVGRFPYGGFPWARLGMTQAESPLAQIASWVGVSGLGFLIVLIAAMAVQIVRYRDLRGVFPVLLPMGLAVGMAFVPAFPTTAVGSIRIGAVQGNGPNAYFDDREPYAVVEAQRRATEPLYGQPMDLLVWPEGGLDADPTVDARIERELARVEAGVGAPILANAVTRRGEELFNTSILWTLAGGVEQSHDKRHPVPFGEYVPDREFFEALAPDLIGLLQREYSFGTNAPIITVDDATLGLAICFDVIYDDVLREGIADGAEAFVFQTNNADFRDTVENLQQLAFARMRAIEAGRWVVNISTVGTSQIVRHDGTTIAHLDADTSGAMLEDVELRTGVTAGIALGSGIEQLLLWGSLGGLVLSGLLSRRRR